MAAGGMTGGSDVSSWGCKASVSAVVRKGMCVLIAKSVLSCQSQAQSPEARWSLEHGAAGGQVHLELKFVLNPKQRPTELEWASPQEKSWAGHTCSSQVANICAELPPTRKWFCLLLGVGEENGPCYLLCSQRTPLTCSKISIHRYLYHLPQLLSKLLLFYIASPRAVVSLRAETKLSFSLPSFPVLSQLTFKTPGSKSHWLYKLIEFSLSGFQGQML